MPAAKKEGSAIKRGSRYHLQLMINGKRYSRAIRSPETGKPATRKEDAKAWQNWTAEQIRQDADGHRKEDLPLTKLEKTYEKFLPNYSKRKGKAHIDASKKSRLAPRTKRVNISTIRQFIKFMKDNYSRIHEAGDIQSVHIEAFMAKKGELKDASYNRYLASVKHIFAVVPHLDASAVANLKGRSKSDVVEDTVHKARFTTEQLAVMQQKATGWIRPAMFVGYYTGLRLGDVLTLQWDEIEDGFIRHITRKSGKLFEAYAPEAIAALEAWRGQVILYWNDALTNTWLAKIWSVSKATAWNIVQEAGGMPDAASREEYLHWIREVSIKAAESGRTAQGLRNEFESLPLKPIPAKLAKFVFPGQAARYLGIDKNEDQTGASKQFQRFLKSCKIIGKDKKGQAEYGFHSLRVTYATMHRIRSGDIEETQKQLRHSNSKTTEIYDRRTGDEIRDELKANYIPVPFPGNKQPMAITQGEEDNLTRLSQALKSLSPEEMNKLLQSLQNNQLPEIS